MIARRSTISRACACAIAGISARANSLPFSTPIRITLLRSSLKVSGDSNTLRTSSSFSTNLMSDISSGFATSSLMEFRSCRATVTSSSLARRAESSVCTASGTAGVSTTTPGTDGSVGMAGCISSPSTPSSRVSIEGSSTGRGSSRKLRSSSPLSRISSAGISSLISRFSSVVNIFILLFFILESCFCSFLKICFCLYLYQFKEVTGLTNTTPLKLKIL